MFSQQARPKGKGRSPVEDLGFDPNMMQQMGIEMSPEDEGLMSGLMSNSEEESLEDYEEEDAQYESGEQELLAEAIDTLQSEWNVSEKEFTSRIQQVIKVWETLPEDQQQQLDSPEGIKLLWNKISSKSSGSKSTKTKSKTMPKFSKRELERLSEADYASHADDILRAYQEGLVGE